MNWSVSKKFVSPKDAKEILEKSDLAGFKNRNISKPYVDKLETVINGGDFLGEAGSVIATTKDGELLNGQHTLTAIINSGIGQDVIRVENARSEAFWAYDDGRKRTVGQNLGAMNVSYSSQKAATIKIIHAYDEGKTTVGGKTSLTNSQQAILINDLEEKHDWINDVFRMTNNLKPLGFRTPVMNAIVIIANRDKWCQEVTEEWFTSLHKMEFDSTYDDPRKALYQRVSKSRNLGSNGMIVTKDFVAYVRAWNAWISGNGLKIVREDGNTPTILPTGDYVKRSNV